jgi:hypothetical protein
MIIKSFKSFKGEHCESTATGALLRNVGIELTEPMIFGLGEGLGFIYWNMKTMDMPFLGGRIKPDLLTVNLCRNLNLKLEVRETTSVKKAWDNVKEFIDKDIPAGIKLDCYYLDYFTQKFHFAAHYATLYGYDNKYVYLNDTAQQGHECKATKKNFELARNEKGPMSSRNRSYTISNIDNSYDINKAIIESIINNAEDYLNPPITNIGYKGIRKTASEIKKWFLRTENKKEDFQITAMLMEKAGTGGALFRNLYRDFLYEASDITGNMFIRNASEAFKGIACAWSEVSKLLNLAGEKEDITYINEASNLLIEISEKEKEAFQKLHEGL